VIPFLPPDAVWQMGRTQGNGSSVWPAGEEQVYVFFVAAAQSGDEAAPNGGKQMNRRSRVQTGQDSQGRPSNAKEFAVFGCRHSCRTWPVIDESNFAEEVSAGEPGEFDFAIAALNRDANASAEDHIHTVAAVPGADNAFASCVPLGGTLLDEAVKFLLAQFGEKGELREKLILIRDFASLFFHRA